MTTQSEITTSVEDLPVTFGEGISTTYYHTKQLPLSAVNLTTKGCVTSQFGMSSNYIYIYIF